MADDRSPDRRPSGRARDPSLPGFIIIGAMKAGTTTLFRRLRQLDDVCMPAAKEPDFFSNDDNWRRGLDWYRARLEPCEGIKGEASTSYSDARFSSVVARRMAQVVPNLRVLYILRDPVERIRSHFRHQVLRGRETRSLGEALSEPRNEYLASSLYGQVLADYHQELDDDQIMTLDTATIDDPAVWYGVLSHIGAAPAPMPREVHNTSDDKRQFTPLLLKIWERKGGIRVPRLLPTAVRRFAKRVLTHEPDADGPISTVDNAIPAPVIDELKLDRALLTSAGVTPERWRSLD